MANSNVNTKRIMKNAAMLYIRMAVIMIVTLYTSRIVLDVLGVVDYGIYTIVGSVVISLSFIQSALNSASQRFLSFEIGLGEKGSVEKVFSMSINIQLIFLVIIIIIFETIGLWFINNFLNIPDNRIFAANIVYQLSILTFCVNVLRVPYNAILISYEKMEIYAILSIVEAILRLIIVYLLLIISKDKLIEYAFLTFCVVLIVNFIYIYYCKFLFKNIISYKFDKDTELLKRMLRFSGWNLVGGLTGMATHECPNYLMNIFIGVKINAAMGIAKQIGSAVFNFTENFQTAFRPQIVKYYASNDKHNLFQLIFDASKISYFLMFIVGFPVLLCINGILDFWLIQVPDYTPEFCSFMIIAYMVNAISSPLWMLAHATGDIKRYQISISLISLLIIPFAWYILFCGYPPYYVIGMQVIINLLIYIYRIYFAKMKTGFPVMIYMKNVVLKSIFLTLLVIPIPILSLFMLNQKIYWIISCFLAFLISVTIFFFGGFPIEYRKKIFDYFKKHIN